MENHLDIQNRGDESFEEGEVGLVLEDVLGCERFQQVSMVV